MKNIVQQEDLIRKYLEENNKEAAIKLLFELSAACAREKNFKAAEEMRERIFQIDPMALSEIIRAGEIIEEEKNETIDKNHREIWARLYNNLNVEEANALYFALKNEIYKPGDMVYRQGEFNPALFFINRGRVKIVYFQNGREVLLKTLTPGEIAGDETFFSNSICTTTMIAIPSTDVSRLDSEVLKGWRKEFPVLESKLWDFASKAEKIKDLLQARELDRRVLKRISVEGKGSVHLMTSSGDQVGKPFGVGLSDISRGGVCLMVHITKKETASLLLGQRLCLSYQTQGEDKSVKVNQKGTVVAIHFHPFEDCSVNLKFDAPLPQKLIDELERFGNPPPDQKY